MTKAKHKVNQYREDKAPGLRINAVQHKSDLWWFVSALNWTWSEIELVFLCFSSSDLSRPWHRPQRRENVDKISKYSNLFKNRETKAFICCQQVHTVTGGGGEGGGIWEQLQIYWDFYPS